MDLNFVGRHQSTGIRMSGYMSPDIFSPRSYSPLASFSPCRLAFSPKGLCATTESGELFPRTTLTIKSLAPSTRDMPPVSPCFSSAVSPCFASLIDDSNMGSFLSSPTRRAMKLNIQDAVNWADMDLSGRAHEEDVNFNFLSPMNVWEGSPYVSPESSISLAAALGEPSISLSEALKEDPFVLPYKSTLMIRNIPHNYTLEMILDEMKARGVLYELDYFYLPGDYRQKRNVGYFFVNVTSEEGVERVKEAWDGICMGQQNGGESKRVQVVFGKIQGKELNLEAYHKSASQHSKSEYRPIILVEGVAHTVDDSNYKPSNLVNAAEMTFMLRNIPSLCTRSLLIDELKQRDVLDVIDFLYVPIDLRHGRSVGYCFINVLAHGVAKFRKAFEGVKIGMDSNKVCTLGFGKIQGLEANIEAYRNSAVMFMADKYHPVLFRNGNMVPFPPPTLSRKESRMVKREKKGVSTRKVDLLETREV